MKKRSIILQFLVSYLLVLLVPMLLGAFAFSRVSGVLRAELRRSNEVSLAQSAQVVERYFRDAKTIASKLAFDHRVLSLLQYQGALDGIAPMRVLEVDRFLTSQAIPSEVYPLVWLYFANLDIIVSEQGNVPDLGSSYGHDATVISFDGMTHAEFRAQVLDPYHFNTYMPAADVSLRAARETVIPVLQTIPVQNVGAQRSSILVGVSAELVAEAFGDSSRSESSFVAVFDMRDSGLLFLETGSALDAEEIPTLETVLSEPDRNGVMTCDIDGEPYSIDHHVAEREELIIVRGVSEGAILSPLRTLQKTSVAILLVVFVVSLGFAFILSRRFSSPLEDVLKTLDGFQARAGTEASGLFDYIRSSVEAMSERNVDLERSLAEQKVSYERLLVFRLLTQGFVNRDDFERRARTAGIIPPSPPYAVVYIDTDTFLERRSTDHELDRLLEVAIVQSLREYGMEWNVALDTSTYLGVFSFSTDSAAFRTVLSEKLSDLGDRWRSEHDVRAVFSVSSVFFDLMDAYDAYLQARTLYERSQLYRDNTVLFYDEQVFQSDRYYYPLELEQRVFYLVQAGEAADLAKLLDELYNENTKPNRNLSRESFQLLATELRGTVYRIRNWLDTNDRLVDEALFSRMREQPENRNRGEQFAEIKRVLVDVANAVGDSKQSHNTQLADRVRVFVEEHYASPDMSLQYMADSIGLSEAYLSRFFKEQMGQNFSAYVTRLRIEKATMYLKSSDMPIKRIASEVGYTRPDAFREAFKRLTGVSPSRFR